MRVQKEFDPTMKKFFYPLAFTFTFFLLGSSFIHGQTEKCISMQMLEKELKEHPELVSKFQSYSESIQALSSTKAGQQKTGGKRIIPVVFHVIHEYGPENISKAQILTQMDRMNKDFSLSNADTSLIPTPFRKLAVNCQIEFRLATKDEKGNCTDGIVRVYSPKSVNASNASEVKSLSYWNSSKYLNIWVVKSIVNTSKYAGDVLGYAQFPFGGLMSTDGIVIRADCIGSIEYANNLRIGRTAVHEIGHWLGLRHIWGDEDCGNDQVDDTPIAFGPNFGVCWDDYPHNATGTKNCNRPKTDTVGEMFMNYMDYVDDKCMAMFTKGQKAIMDLTLNSFRSYLWSDANLEATGTRDEDIAAAKLCSPTADFYYLTSSSGDFSDELVMICEDKSLSFKDASYFNTTTTPDWEFEGGSPATSKLASPSILYSDPGLYDVKITTTNASGTSQKIRNNFVMVSPLLSAFSDASYQKIEENSDQWIILNSDKTLNTWQNYSGQGSTGNSFRMNNYDNRPAESDLLISPSFNIKKVTTPVLSFKLAYAEQGGTPGDNLSVSSSIDCGRTWAKLRTWVGADLITAGLFTEYYVPSTNNNQWATVYVPLAALGTRENVRFKFEFTSGSVRGNNLYLDEINIGTALGLEDPNQLIGLSLMPNPTQGISKAQFYLSKPSSVSVSVMDITGKLILNPQYFSGHEGLNEVDLLLQSLPSGLYMLKLDTGVHSAYRKFIKE